MISPSQFEINESLGANQQRRVQESKDNNNTSYNIIYSKIDNPQLIQ